MPTVPGAGGSFAAPKWIAEVEHHAAIDSTNTRALRRIAEPGVPLPLLVTADRQTAGRGRRGAPWWMGPRSLAFSLAIEPARHNLSDHQVGPLGLVAAAAVCSAVTNLIPADQVGSAALRLKWPNDVLAGGKKLAGVLVETRVVAGRLRAVIGIGMNVNDPAATAPDEIAHRAVSLIDLTTREHEPASVLELVLDALGARLGLLASDPAACHKEWSSLCALLGTPVELDTPEGPLAGTALGISPDGALLVATRTGERAIRSGSLTRFG